MTSQQCQHAKLQKVEAVLVSTWEREGLRTWNDRGIVFGVVGRVTSYEEGVVETDHVSLTKMAEDIIAELEL